MIMHDNDNDNINDNCKTAKTTHAARDDDDYDDNSDTLYIK